MRSAIANAPARPDCGQRVTKQMRDAYSSLMPGTLEEMCAFFDLGEMKWPAPVRALGRDRMAAFAFCLKHEKPLFTYLNEVFAAVEVHD